MRSLGKAFGRKGGTNDPARLNNIGLLGKTIPWITFASACLLIEMKANMDTKQDIVRIESKIDDNHKALYDGYKQSIEAITEVRGKLDKLNDRV